METDTPAIAVSGLRKAYGTRQALAGIDLTVQRGELIAVLGPNGAGKTTMVEILEGHRRPDAGQVRVLGHDPALRERAFRERIGIVLQDTGIDPSLTVHEAIDLYSAAYPDRRDADDVIELVGLTGSRNVRAEALSGGQRRRLDLAVALAGNPELIFLDEPTTGFDPAARRAAWDTVRALRDLGKTILLTTHYLDEAQALADRVAIVKAGEILAEGPPGRLGVGAARFRVSWRAADGGIEERTTDDPTALLHELTGAALARGERLEELSVTRPSLEDVYLELTAEEVGAA